MNKIILIIDDDMTFQKTLTTKLESLSYKVLSAYDGEDGYIKALGEKPDLILLDINMPKLDGLRLLKKLRDEDKRTPEVPVIITSNMSGIDRISEGVALGIVGYITKSNETLDTIVKEVQAILNPKIRETTIS